MVELRFYGEGRFIAIDFFDKLNLTIFWNRQGKILRFGTGRHEPTQIVRLEDIMNYKGPLTAEVIRGQFAFEYDEVSGSVRVVVTEGHDKLVRAVNIPVLAKKSGPEMVRELFEGTGLVHDPFGAPAEDDLPWLQANLEKLVGIEDEPFPVHGIGK